MNKRMLRAVMILHGDTRDSLAEAMGLSPTTLSYKMNESHGRCFDKSEIECIAKRYQLSEPQILEIFFKNCVS